MYALYLDPLEELIISAFDNFEETSKTLTDKIVDNGFNTYKSWIECLVRFSFPIWFWFDFHFIEYFPKIFLKIKYNHRSARQNILPQLTQTVDQLPKNKRTISNNIVITTELRDVWLRFSLMHVSSILLFCNFFVLYWQICCVV